MRFSAVLLLLPFSLLPAKDIPSSKDHPLIKRFEGSGIIFHKQNSFERLRLIMEPIVFNYNDQKYEPYKHIDTEGKRTTIYYVLPEGVSPLEAIRNYENEFKEKGFEILFQAGGEKLERNKGDNLAGEVYGVTSSNTDQDHPDMAGITSIDLSKSQYIAARLPREEGDIYASVLAIESSRRTAGAFKIPEKVTVVRLDVCEVKAMPQRMVTVSAGEMANQINSTGRVALYGIFFDFNKAEVKPESGPTLQEIAKLLNGNAKLRLLVVGHTDGIGSFEGNRTLSQKRAEAVAAVLTSKHGVNAGRLFPVGVSFAAPIATNSTEDGRAKNRRVELVEMTAAEDKW